MEKKASGSLKRSGFLGTTIFIGLVAGTADGLAAIISAYGFNGVGPGRVFQYIASGIFGRAAFDEPVMAIVGLLLHYMIATTWAFLYMALYRRFKLYSVNVYLGSLLYGCFVWLVMNKVVLPLSNVAMGSPNLVRVLVGIGVLVIAIGWPVTYMSRRYYSER